MRRARWPGFSRNFILKGRCHVLVINNPHTNPYFNLAMEEHLLTDVRDDIVMLWRNDKAVIIGRNQNALEEINQSYVEKAGIAVVRRLTGGGAVFHDLGNVNFTFIQHKDVGAFSDYRRFTQPVCDFLETLGVHAELSGRNDLMIDGMKISGNAQTVRADRIMHHGTLLFDANLADVSAALNPNKVKMASKGTQSVRSHVTNISSHLREQMGVEDFLGRLYTFFSTRGSDAQPYDLTGEDVRVTEGLVRDKYGTWEWNYGRSPAYNFQQTKRFDCGTVDLRLNVKDGVIDEAVLYGDFFGVMDKSSLEQAVVGHRHRPQDIEQALAGLDVGSYVSGLDKAQLLELFF